LFARRHHIRRSRQVCRSQCWSVRGVHTTKLKAACSLALGLEPALRPELVSVHHPELLATAPHSACPVSLRGLEVEHWSRRVNTAEARRPNGTRPRRGTTSAQSCSQRSSRRGGRHHKTRRRGESMTEPPRLAFRRPFGLASHGKSQRNAHGRGFVCAQHRLFLCSIHGRDTLAQAQAERSIGSTSRGLSSPVDNRCCR